MREYRTEVITSIFLDRIKPNGGHPGLCEQSIDWIRTPSLEGTSYICLREGTAYVIGLFDRHDKDIAVVGYDLCGKTCIVRQLQGQFGGEGSLLRGWERVLLATIVRLAEISNLKKVEVTPSWMSSWYTSSSDPEHRERLATRYDRTPRALGFACAEKSGNTHHIKYL